MIPELPRDRPGMVTENLTLAARSRCDRVSTPRARLQERGSPMTNLNHRRMLAATVGIACLVLSTPVFAKSSKSHHQQIDAARALHHERHARSGATVRRHARHARR